jgi:hypothetical protein
MFLGYKKIYPDIAHFQAYFANFGAFWPFEPMGIPDQYWLVYMYSLSCYVSIPSHLGLNNLDFSSYNKI